MAILFALFGIVAFAINAVVLICILKYKRLQTKSNLLLANLVVADLMVGVTTPLNVLVYTRGSRLSCFLQYACGFQTCFFCIASILLLVVISIERYVHIVRYHKYLAIFTTKRTLFMAGCAWVLSGTLYVIYRFIVGLYFHIVLLCVTNFVLLIISFCYWKIFRRVRESTKALANHGSPQPDLTNTAGDRNNSGQVNPFKAADVGKPEVTEGGCDVKVNAFETKVSTVRFELHVKDSPDVRPIPEKAKSLSRMQKHYQIAKTMAGIIIAATVSWAPFMTISFIRSLEMYMTKEQDSYASLYHWFLLLGFANSVMNPLIYSWKNGNVREAMKSLFRFGNRRSMVVDLHAPSATGYVSKGYQ